MKKISSKIVLFSLLNSLMITILSAVINTIMREDSMAPIQNVAGSTDFQPPALGLFPTPVIISTILSLVLGAVFSYFLGRYIAKPIVKITQMAYKTSTFDLSQDDSYDKILKYKDECGQMALAMSEIRQSLREMGGKLQSITFSLENHSNSMATATDDNVRSITQVVSTINEIAEGNGNQADTIGTINETMGEVAQLVESVTAETENGADNAIQSMNTIQEGQKAVDTQIAKMELSMAMTNESAKSIQELSSMIENVASLTKVITSIANQTNLLALNAAIEAARAGEAGQGFAVVADEIRKLAEDSSASAKEIIETIGQTTQKSSLAVNNMNRTMALVGEQKEALTITQDVFNKITEAYKHITVSFQQSAGRMEDINTKVRLVSDQTQDISAISQEMAASTEQISAEGEEQLAATETINHSSKELLQLANALSNELKRFKLE